MKLQDLAKKPVLIEITIDDEDIVKEFGESISFWTWDRQPMDVFLKLASIDQKDTNSLVEAVRNLILDEAGKPIITKDAVLPTKVLMKVITTVVDKLGKF